MKKFFLSTVSALALAHGASAADLPYRAPPATYKAPPVPLVVPTWAGFYVGVQGGVASHRASLNDLNGMFLTRPGIYDSTKTGGIFGVNAGYNVQSGSLVFGVEGDWSGLGVKAGSVATQPAICPNCAFSTSYDVRWLATARARVGLAVDATLFYLTGGVAFGRVSNSGSFLFNNVVLSSFTDSRTKAGGVVGGGIEHMFARNWTVRAEARYVNLGRSTVNCVAPGGGACGLTAYRGEFRNSLLMGLVGVDFKF